MTASDKAPDRAYIGKTDQYFAGVRQDFLDSLPTVPGLRILEVGCGFGETGRAALETGRAAEYVGVELFEKAAEIARKHLTKVVAGDVETVDLPWPPGHFDAVLMSEVLEHLVDPWRVVARIVPLIRGGGLVMASSPNVAQIRTVRNLLAGRWELADSGLMDRTHLRWFTPTSYREMFERAGVTVDSVTPLSPAGRLGKIFNIVTFNQFAYLTVRQIVVTGRAPGPGARR
jgi:2-polyprenyl-3-methyl-5-hydroxy-6-metoxy-1,4-benzoquinol methylase